MRWSLPPHIAWPMFVVGILLMSVCAVAATVFAANSDGGVQVIDAYYDQSVNWDENAEAQATSDRLGWTTTLRVLPVDSNSLRPVEITVRDGHGAPISGLRGTVRLERPQLAKSVTELPLAADSTEPGVYRLMAPINAAGLWDFHLRATHDGNAYLTVIREEVE